MNEMLKRTIVGLIAGALFFGTYLFVPFVFLFIFFCCLVYILTVEWLGLILRLKGKQLVIVSLATIPYIAYPAMIITFVLLGRVIGFERNIFFPIYPFCAASVFDTASYFAGSLLGKRKLIPKISPKKTWEGLLGGVAVLALFNIVILPEIFTDIGTVGNWTIIISSTLVGSALAFSGDIFASWVKRKAGVKDTGAVMPGHGGLLDRADSVLGMAYIIPFWTLLERVL